MVGRLLLSTLLAAPGLAAASEEVRAFVATATSDKGGAVTGVGADEVAILENGVTRDLVSIDADERPVTLAFIIDTSEATHSALRLNLVGAATTFLKSLPDGSRFALWSTGDRPTKVLDYTSDRVEAQKALARLFPRGGNTLLDAVAEASADLGKQGEKGAKQEGERSVVVALTGLDPELSNRDKWRVVEEAEKKAGLFMAVSYAEGEGDFEDRQKFDYVLSTLSRQSGGRYETVLSPMAVAQAMGKLLDDLRSQYRVKYVAAPDLKDKDRKIEVKIARPAVKVRIGRSTIS
jgi:Mg-chelatase subunit ChlD